MTSKWRIFACKQFRNVQNVLRLCHLYENFTPIFALVTGQVLFPALKSFLNRPLSNFLQSAAARTGEGSRSNETYI